MSNEVPPRWILDSIFPGLESREFAAAKAELSAQAELFRDHLRRARPVDRPSYLDWLEKSISSLNKLTALGTELMSYLYCLYSTDTQNGEVMSQMNAVEAQLVPVKAVESLFRKKLLTFSRKFGSDAGSSGTTSSGVPPTSLAPYEFFIQESLQFAKRQMSPAEEELAAELNRSGAEAWGRLQEVLTSSMTRTWDDGSTKTLVDLRSLAYHEDRKVRWQAYKLELDCLEEMELPLAAALNGVKGASHSLNSRRGYKSTLERSLRQNRISSKTLKALLSAMKAGLPILRRYLLAKAKLLGLRDFGFYDIFAPVPLRPGAAGDIAAANSASVTSAAANSASASATVDAADTKAPAGATNTKAPANSAQPGREAASHPTIPFSEARTRILELFGSFSTELADFARLCFESGWIDAEPRQGKVGGAYSIDFPLSNQSRILANYDGSFSSISTLAHEIGHAFHSWQLRDRPPLVRDYPMTLAETASIFCETLVYNSALESAAPAERVSLLEGLLSENCQVIVDILSRYYFETEVMRIRKDRELSPDELGAIMIEAQRKTYGNTIARTGLHPYMWAVKGHYYNHDLAFYNFPYAFGQLFGLALFDAYSRSPAEFPGQYSKLLAQTGSTDAVSLCRSAGYDIESPEFWLGGIRIIEGYVSLFEEEVGKK